VFRIPLTRPAVGEDERREVEAVLASGVLTEGAWTERLEAQVAAFTGARHAVAVTSCTTGLELSLRALGVGPGHEVIVPDYTYPATATAVLAVGATPVIVDVEPDTWLLDLERAAAAVGPRTRAVVPVSLFGNPLDAPRMRALCAERGLALLEDAACALGAEHGGRRTGGLADLTVFSLHPRKTLTTGEGGLVTTDDAPLAEWIRSLKRFGLGVPEGGGPPRFLRPGTNAKLSNVLAAIGVAQMQRAEELLERRAACAERYAKLLAAVPGVERPAVTPGGRHGWQTFCVRIPGRDRVLRELREAGIEVQIGTFALHREPVFAEGGRARLAGPFDASRDAFERALALPLYDGLGEDEQHEVVERLDAALARGPR